MINILYRVHYHIKKALAKEKQLEFLWQQSWGKKKLFSNFSINILNSNRSKYLYTNLYTYSPILCL
jgi:hypothetical protein